MSGGCGCGVHRDNRVRVCMNYTSRSSRLSLRRWQIKTRVRESRARTPSSEPAEEGAANYTGAGAELLYEAVRGQYINLFCFFVVVAFYNFFSGIPAHSQPASDRHHCAYRERTSVRLQPPSPSPSPITCAPIYKVVVFSVVVVFPVQFGRACIY